MTNLKMGIYRHYKGPLYQVISLAHDAKYEDRTLVVYVALQLDPAKRGPRFAVRDLEEFEALVCTDEESSHYGEEVKADGVKVKPRFEYLGDDFSPWMLS